MRRPEKIIVKNFDGKNNSRGALETRTDRRIHAGTGFSL